MTWNVFIIVFCFAVQFWTYNLVLIFQAMIPEAFAIVMAPNDTSRSSTGLSFDDMGKLPLPIVFHQKFGYLLYSTRQSCLYLFLFFFFKIITCSWIQFCIIEQKRTLWYIQYFEQNLYLLLLNHNLSLFQNAMVTPLMQWIYKLYVLFCRSCGLFRLTEPDGMNILRDCPEKGFHPHKEPDNGNLVYDHCSNVYKNANLRFEIFDLR